MRVIVADNYEALSASAADWLADQIRRRPNLLLCAATGSSPKRAYELLTAKKLQEPSLFDRLRVLKLDEWGGLAMDDTASGEAYMRRWLVQPLGVSADRYFAFQSNPADPQAECARLRAVLEREGPIDICVLGLGANGHLALNEPGDQLHPFVHVAELAEESRHHGMLASAATPPAYGMTIGMADILQSREVLLLVSGVSKCEPFRRLLTRRISTQCPASFLWLHPKVTCFCDRDAAGEERL